MPPLLKDPFHTSLLNDHSDHTEHLVHQHLSHIWGQCTSRRPSRKWEKHGLYLPAQPFLLNNWQFRTTGAVRFNLKFNLNKPVHIKKTSFNEPGTLTRYPQLHDARPLIKGYGPDIFTSTIVIQCGNPCRWSLADRFVPIISVIKLIWAKAAIHLNCSDWQIRAHRRSACVSERVRSMKNTTSAWNFSPLRSRKIEHSTGMQQSRSHQKLGRGT